jgi:hypothetical protein
MRCATHDTVEAVNHIRTSLTAERPVSEGVMTEALRKIAVHGHAERATRR